MSRLQHPAPGSDGNIPPRPVVAWIDSIGLIGPGMPDWTSVREVLAAAQPWQPSPTVAVLPPILPPAERRRSSLAVRIALAAGHSAVAASSFPTQQLRSVFASSGGDGMTCHLICDALAQQDRRISPTQFHNSVHNAPSGYWGIAMRSTAASTSLCAHDSSFSAGLLEAIMQLQESGEPVLLVAYDAPYPDPLRACRPVADAFGVALVLSPHTTGKALMRMSLTLQEATATRMTEAGLEAMRRGIPSARSLPLLQAVARQQEGMIAIDYIDSTDAGRVATRICLALTPAAGAGAGVRGFTISDPVA